MQRAVEYSVRLTCIVMLVALVAGGAVRAQTHDGHGHHGARDLSVVAPADVGLSSARLERLAASMEQMVADGKLAGVVTMLARHGKVAFVDAVGVQDVESATPISTDTIFRIYSMTKPITGVAMMMLYEEGLWRLNDPVSKYIPEFADLQVRAGESADGAPVLQDAQRSMTMRELMTHSGGLAYALTDADPMSSVYRTEGVLNADAPLQVMIEKLGTLPLRAQPGTSYFYSISVDVQGYLVEKLSGQPFDEFLLSRIFEPLGMVNTAFFVPAGREDRAGREHRVGESGELELTGTEIRTRPPAGPSGGGGLYSTVGDYLRFTQMLLNGGALDGARLLAPRTIEMMRTNHLLDEPLGKMAQGQGLPLGYTASPGQGFGLDFAVVMDAAAAGEPWPNGTAYWYGAAGTWFWIDPETDLAFVGMIQHRGAESGEVQGLSRNLVYQAIVH
jgi:CubicO group peptidase (beta-lactamase class C family)